MLAVTVTPGAAFVTGLIVFALGLGTGLWLGFKARRGVDRVLNLGLG